MRQTKASQKKKVDFGQVIGPVLLKAQYTMTDELIVSYLLGEFLLQKKNV